MTILSEIDTGFNWPAAASWEFGLIQFLAIAVLFLTFVHLAKKIFGRKPPMDEQIKQMYKLLKAEIHREKNSVLKETKLKLDPLILRLVKAETGIEDIQLDRARKWETLTTQMHEIANNVAFIRGERKGEQQR